MKIQRKSSNPASERKIQGMCSIRMIHISDLVSCKSIKQFSRPSLKSVVKYTDPRIQQVSRSKVALPNPSKRNSMISVQSMESQTSIEEEHDTWGCSDIRLKSLLIDDDKSTQTFLSLYKARFGGYPGAEEKIKNEDVIRAAIAHAASSKKVFKKYFPKKEVVFEDYNDYSQPYKIQEDANFKEFETFYHNKQETTRKKILPSLKLLPLSGNTKKQL